MIWMSVGGSVPELNRSGPAAAACCCDFVAPKAVAGEQKTAGLSAENRESHFLKFWLFEQLAVLCFL
jgi:hypothetical protein